MEFNDLMVSEVTKQTDSCVSVSFDVPTDLSEKYAFIPGQYLTLETEINGKQVRRSYSICSDESEPLQVAIKVVDGGEFSTWANQELKAGMTLRVARPEGNFTHQVESTNRNQYVAFVAGSGITPILSIMKSVLQREPQSTFVLFYGNKRTQDIIFREQIEGLKNKFMNRISLFYILSQEKTDAPILSGRISADNCKDYFKYLIPQGVADKVFLCGPYDMIMSMKTALLEQAIHKEKIKFELFYNPQADGNKQAESIKAETANERVIKITLDGLTSEIKTNYDMPVLDIAIEAGMDLPFSCKGGVCATCKAKVTEGDVEMTMNFALEKEEVDAGYVLTCQSHIKSDFAHVNFDA